MAADRLGMNMAMADGASSMLPGVFICHIRPGSIHCMIMPKGENVISCKISKLKDVLRDLLFFSENMLFTSSSCYFTCLLWSVRNVCVKHIIRFPCQQRWHSPSGWFDCLCKWFARLILVFKGHSAFYCHDASSLRIFLFIFLWFHSLVVPILLNHFDGEHSANQLIFSHILFLY